MGLPVEVNNLMLGSLGGYTVGRSLRFRSSASAYLSRTFGTPTSQKKGTISYWFKLGITTPSSFAGSVEVMYGSRNTTTGNNPYIGFANNSLRFNDFDGSAGTGDLVSTAVYRDPSSWYHFVVAIDSTQATSTDRVKMYVNGVQITSFSTANYPSLNRDMLIFASGAQYIGYSTPGNSFIDGYMAELNYIDGQALTPSSFGAYDTNGVWQPKKYTGTYGTNGFYLPFSLNTTATYEGVFNGSSQSIGIPANSGFSFGSGNFTAECWVNAKSFSSFPALIDFWSNSSPSYITGQWQLGISTAGLLTMTIATSGSAVTTIQQSSGSVILNTWNHVAVVRNGTTVTLYLNGVSVGSSTFTGTVGHSTGAGGLAKQSNSAVAYLNGSLSNIRITNNAVYTAGFTPSTSPLTAISGTQLLTLQNSTLVDNSVNAISLTNNGSVTFPVSYPFSIGTAISNDQSGNGNNWTPNNISLTAGTTYDSMIDSPTVGATASNYAVLNPNFVTPSTTFSNGNLTVTKTAAVDVMAVSTIAMPSSKWYWEITITSLSASSNLVVGIVKNTQTNGTYSNTLAVLWNGNGNATRYGTSLGAVGTTFATNDVLGIALDMDSGTVSLYKNNTFIGTVTGVDTTIPHYAFWDSYANGESASFNFGQRPFAYTPPSGFKALNTYNLPAPSIANGAQYMAATTYTGNGTAGRVITVPNINEVGFAWVKSRSGIDDHRLANIVTGGNKHLKSNTTDAESTGTNIIQAFSSNTFTVGNDTSVNANGSTYVGWTWAAGGTGVTNNSGTITSTVSASASSGFSVVTYTGTGANGTIGHGLGVAPSMIIIKNRQAANSWVVYHVSTGNGNVMLLNSTNASTADSTAWNTTTPTSSVFSVGSGAAADTNQTSGGGQHVAYCFSAVSGYSAFGKYTGNGSTNGPFIYTGFRPRFIMIKNATAVNNWGIIDTSRDTYNGAFTRLHPNLSQADNTGAGVVIDVLSNGFKCRNSDPLENQSGQTIIYAAFAEHPFNYSRAR